jgi:hypothetical protein
MTHLTDLVTNIGKMRGGLVIDSHRDTTDPNKTYIGAYALQPPKISLDNGVTWAAMTQEYAPSGGAAGLWNYIADLRTRKLPTPVLIRTQNFRGSIVPGQASDVVHPPV